MRGNANGKQRKKLFLRKKKRIFIPVHAQKACMKSFRNAVFRFHRTERNKDFLDKKAFL